MLSSSTVRRQSANRRSDPEVGVLPTTWRVGVIAIVAATAIGCNANLASERLSRARHLSADLLVQFTKAADATNKAVMADTDEASAAFAREAERANQAVRTDVDALKPILQGLDYTGETRLLEEFENRFAEYRELDRRILELAVENTNLKGQRLAFGPARAEADQFRDSLEGVVSRDTAGTWRVKALAATAVAEVRQVQVLQAPHIADADDAAMTRMERGMDASVAGARRALEALLPLADPASRTRIAAATAALDRFVDLNAQIVGLSRRNTNVRSIELSLRTKPPLTAACDESLRALQDLLAKEGIKATR